MENWPIGTYEQCSSFSIAAEMIENELIHPEKLITHRYALTNYRAAFATITAKSRSRATKVVFDYALLPATVVPNVRASAHQRHPVATTAAWPQDQQSVHEETNLVTPPDEYFVQPSSPVTPEPVEEPAPTTQDAVVEIVEIEETHQFLFEEQPEHIPSFTTEEAAALEDQDQPTTPIISKPKRSRQSTKSQKNTEDIQATDETIENSTETIQIPDSLEE